MSQLLGYFYSIPISIAFFLVLWAIKRGRATHRKPASWGDAEKQIKKRSEELEV